MALTPDQKKALYIVGGVAAVAALFYLLQRQSTIPETATSVQTGPGFVNSPPGYTSYNIPFQPPPSITPNPRLPLGAGYGCCNSNDGCFTASPLDTGRGPVA